MIEKDYSYLIKIISFLDKNLLFHFGIEKKS